MVDKNININAKIETSSMIGGVKQMSDEIKKFASAADRAGNLISNSFKNQTSVVRDFNKSLREAEQNLKKAWSLSKDLSTGMAKVRLDNVSGGIFSTGLQKQAQTYIYQLDRIKQLQNTLQNSVKPASNQSLIDIINKNTGVTRIQAPKITFDTSTFNPINNAVDNLKNKLKELFNLPQGKTLLAGMAGGAAVMAISAIGQAVKRLADDVIKLGEESVKMSVTYDRLTNRFNAASGGIKSGTESWLFMKNLSKEMGVSFVETSDSFGTFEAAALRSGMSMQQTQQVFSDISSAVVSLQLDSYRTGLSFMALSQMASKGTVSMEELKRQLGESLPGAVQIGAKAMGMTNAQFQKMVEEGKILSSDFLPKFAAQIKKDLGGSLATASQQARAEFHRLVNATNDLKDSLGDLINLALVPLVRQLTPILSQMARSIGTFAEIEKVTGNFKNTIQGISNALGTGGLILTLGLVITNLGRIGTALKTVASLFGAVGAAINLNPYILLATVIGTTLVGAFEALKKAKSSEIVEAEKSVVAAINEKNEFNRLSDELSPVISKYEELRQKKNRTNEEQKTFIKLQKKIIEVFPDMKTVIDKHGSVIAGLADKYNTLNENMLKSQLIVEKAKVKSIEDSQKPLAAPVFGPGGVVTFSNTKTLKAAPLSKEKQLELDTAKRNVASLELQLEMSKVSGTGTVKTENTTKDDKAQEVARLRKKQYDDEIKSIENNLNLKIAKNRYSEEELLNLKQEYNTKKLDVANKYYSKESYLLNKEDYKQDIQKLETDKFELLKQSANNKSNLYLDSQDKLLQKSLTDNKLSEEKELELKIEYNNKKLKEVNSFIDSNKTKEKDWLDKKHELEVNAKNLSTELENKKLENKLKAIEMNASKELALTYMTEEEKLSKVVEVEQKRLELYEKNKDEIENSVIVIAEQQNKVWEAQRAVIEDQLKYIKGLFDGIESSFKDSVSGILKGQTTLKDGFTSLIAGIKNAWMDMIVQMIVDFMKLQILDPIMKNIFSSMQSGYKSSGTPSIMSTIGKMGLSLFSMDTGGIVPGSFSTPIPLVAHGSEMILNPRQQSSMFNMIDGGGSIGNKKESENNPTANYVYAPQIKTGASADDVFKVLETHSRQFFSIVADGMKNNKALRSASMGA